ncbi:MULTISPECIES: hypothetical protein [Actinoplanes]|uniref:hypothetical protein n=1 Tax=Actinoplanes TaxID=1865 RepID=UPI0005F2E88C|nr:MULTISPECIES: hypothetical protein [Actinoplanes]GLY06486.1 hypothetical protein Acsp01_68650 [Actinoplanes sp. NBRC 101535]
MTPRLHFTPRVGELGELLGVAVDGGRYRLFHSQGSAVSDDLVLWTETGEAGEAPAGQRFFPLGPDWVDLRPDADGRIGFGIGGYDGSVFTARARGVFGWGGVGMPVTFADAAGRRCLVAGVGGSVSLPWVLSVRDDRLLAAPHPHLDRYLITGAAGLTVAGGEIRDHGEVILRMPAGGETVVLADGDIVEAAVEGVSGLGAARRRGPATPGARMMRFA